MDSKFIMGNFLCALRREKGLSQTQVGMLLGVTNKAVSKWENGDNRPEVGMLYRLSALYGVSVDELVRGARLDRKDGARIAIENETLKKKIEDMEGKERKNASLFFVTDLFLLTVVVLFFVFAWLSFIPYMNFKNAEIAADWLTGLAVLLSIPIGLAGLLSAVELVFLYARRCNPAVIIVMLVILPITLCLLEIAGIIADIPLLIKNRRSAYRSRIPFSNDQKKAVGIIASSYLGAFALAALALTIALAVFPPLPYASMTVDLILFLAIAVMSFLFAHLARKKQII